MRNIIFATLIVFCFIAVGCSGKVKDNTSEHFHDGGDGTVTDLITGFIWQKSYVKKNWETANTYCEGLEPALMQILATTTILCVCNAGLHGIFTAINSTS